MDNLTDPGNPKPDCKGTPIADLIDASTFETLHLTKSAANRMRLEASIKGLEDGISETHDLIEE